MSPVLVVVGWIVIFLVACYASFMFVGACIFTAGFGGRVSPWILLALIPVGGLWYLAYYMWPFQVAMGN